MKKNSADDNKDLRDFNVFGGAVSRGGEDTQIKINVSYDNASTWISDGVLISAASYTVIM